MHTAFLLAAGLGTRLRPLTLVRPKALLPVCGVPMLDYALAHARAHGHEAILVNAHHLWPAVAAWATRNEVSLQVEWPQILGTGGGLKAAADRLAERVVVLNADVLNDVDLGALREAVPPGGAAMALRPSPDAAAIRAVEADAAGFVRHMADIQEGTGGLPGTHFTGVHALDRAVLTLVPDSPGDHCVVRTAYKALLPEGRLRATRHLGLWVDVGTPRTYLEANLAVLDGRIRPPLDPWTRGARGPGGSWVGADARVAGEITGSVIGDRAVVPAGARLRGCVVWDGVEVPEGDFEHCVIYGEGQVLQVDLA